MKKRTNAQLMQMRMTGNMYLILSLLGWTELEYATYKYNCGLIYLTEQMNGSDPDVEIMERRSEYWGWWKTHWYLRETELLDRLISRKDFNRMTTKEFTFEFGKINHPWLLAKAETPDGRLLYDSFCFALVPALNKALR